MQGGSDINPYNNINILNQGFYVDPNTQMPINMNNMRNVNTDSNENENNFADQYNTEHKYDADYINNNTVKMNNNNVIVKTEINKNK